LLVSSTERVAGATYGALGNIAQERGDYDEAERQYQRALDIFQRLGNQANMAITYGALGNLARSRGDYDEAERQYQRALAIEERLGDQVGMATTYFNLGLIAQHRGDYDEATRQYQRSLDIDERLGNLAGMAASYNQMAILEAARGGNPAQVIGLHVQALGIRLRLGAPQALNDLRRLAAYRDELGPERFEGLLAQTTGDADQAETIMSLLGQLGQAEDDGT
jgi:tetratricopeptide (TPR) repeat protein